MAQCTAGPYASQPIIRLSHISAHFTEDTPVEKAHLSRKSGLERGKSVTAQCNGARCSRGINTANKEARHFMSLLFS